VKELGLQREKEKKRKKRLNGEWKIEN